MDMIRQYDNGIDHEWVSCTRFLHGNAESIHAIDEEGVPTLKKIDREEPAPSGYECATIIWHPCSPSIMADYASLIRPTIYCGLRGPPPAAGGLGGGGASAGALPLPPPPNNSRVGLRSRLFTARLISPRVRRPSAIRAPDRLSKSSASSLIDFTIAESSPPELPPAIAFRPSMRPSGLPITPSTFSMTLSIFSELRASAAVKVSRFRSEFLTDS